MIGMHTEAVGGHKTWEGQAEVTSQLRQEGPGGDTVWGEGPSRQKEQRVLCPKARERVPGWGPVTCSAWLDHGDRSWKEGESWLESRSLG